MGYKVTVTVIFVGHLYQANRISFFTICRQQRDEIARKKEKMESMLKGKRNSSTGLRPESPTSRRKRSIKRAIVPTRRLTNARGNMEVSTGS